MFDPEQFITDRTRAIDASGIRRVFDLAANLEKPINLSIGQPHFDVPGPIKAAAIEAIEKGFNSYTVTQGAQQIRRRVEALIRAELPHWNPASSGEASEGASECTSGGASGGTFETLITSGVSGGLVLALLTCAGPGDEVLLPDPYFVMYRHLVTLTGATPVFVDTYPDFQLTAERVEPHISARTKMLMFSSPSNPTGVVTTDPVCRQIVDLADEHGFLVVSDEIYNEFCYEKIERPIGSGILRAPSPAAYSDRILLLRGFSKTYGMTGWRLGFAAGPGTIIEHMTKLQQYTFVCAPSMVQLAGIAALDLDMSEQVEQYRAKRDRVASRLAGVFNLTTPGGAFYAFPEVPPRLGLTGDQFIEKAVRANLLVIPGSVFSNRDTHIRLSYACDDDELDKGLDILLELAEGRE